MGVWMFKCKPGVYTMMNSVTGNFYIGSSKDVSNRIKTHKYNLRCGYKDNIRIKLDLEKTSYDSFVFSALEYCDQSVMKEREQYYFELLRPTYNVWKNVFSAKGRSYTEDQMASIFVKRQIKDIPAFREKLREAWSIRKTNVDYKESIKHLDRTGFKHSDETKKQYSLLRKGKRKSPETIEKMRQRRLGTKWDAENRTWIKKGENLGI